jgi:RNA polymerase sigma-70 factor (ECF subfamily)
VPNRPSEPAADALAPGRPTDGVLVVAARAGERWAKEALFRRHAPHVMGLAYRLLGSDVDLEDVAQEAYFQALSSLDRLRDADAFGAWMAGILVRCVHRLLRRRRMLRRLGLRDAVPVDPDVALSPGAPADVVAELRGIYAVLDALSTEARLALVLHRVEGFSVPEVARLLDCSPSTVKRRLSEAAAALERVPSEVAAGPRSRTGREAS